VLQDQLDLQFAALDCYKAVADNLPTELTLDSFQFASGESFCSSAAPREAMGPKVQDFNEQLKKVIAKGSRSLARSTRPGGAAGRQTRFPGTSLCELKRTTPE